MFRCTFPSFIGGLSEAGEGAYGILDDLDLNTIRLRKSFLSLAGADDLLGNAVAVANEAWEENTALATEAGKRYETAESKVQLMKNAFSELGIVAYDDLREPYVEVIETITNATKELTEYVGGPDGIGDWINNIGTALPTLQRKFKKYGEPVFNGIWNVGKWVIKHGNGFISLIVGIGSAMAAYKVASTLTHIVNAIASLGSMSPVTLTILGLVSAIGLLTTAYTAYKQKESDLVNENLANHFGNIALSMEELQAVAEHIIGSDSLNSVNELLIDEGVIDDADMYLVAKYMRNKRQLINIRYIEITTNSNFMYVQIYEGEASSSFTYNHVDNVVTYIRRGVTPTYALSSDYYPEEAGKIIAINEYGTAKPTPVSEVAIPIPQTAEVGQFIKVTEVDENGKPTAWEVDDPDWERMKNKPFYEKESIEQIIPPTEMVFTVTTNDDGGIITNSVGIDGTAWLDKFAVGDVLTVIIDGKEYACTVEAFKAFRRIYVRDDDGNSLYQIGLPLTDVGNETFDISAECFTEAGTYTINLSMSRPSTELKTIEEKFMPDLPDIPATIPNIPTANVGQMILVKAVDENNVPTEWEVVDRTHYTYMAPAVIYKSENLTPNVRVDVEEFNYQSTAKVNIYSPDGILLYSNEFESQNYKKSVAGVGIVINANWYGNGELSDYPGITETKYTDAPIVILANTAEDIDEPYFIYLDDSFLSETYDSYIVEVFDAINTVEAYSPLDEAYIPSAIARTADVNAGLAEKVTAPQTATVGQVIAVKAVDENGVPKEWECVDLPEGFSGSWNDLEDKPFGESCETFVQLTGDEWIHSDSVVFPTEGIEYVVIIDGVRNYKGIYTPDTDLRDNQIAGGSLDVYDITTGEQVGNVVYSTDLDISTENYYSSCAPYLNYETLTILKPVTKLLDETYLPSTIQRVGDDVIIQSSTEGSSKKFKITVDDSGTITATEVTE